MIIDFGKDLSTPVPDGAISFDFDGTLTRWKPTRFGWAEEGNPAVIRRLLFWQGIGRKVYITTHRTKELEGSPVFATEGQQKITIKDFLQKYRIDLPDSQIVFTHNGDKAKEMKQRNIVLHYDDEMENLESTSRADIIAVRVEGLEKPPKLAVPGDGSERSARRRVIREYRREVELEVAFDG